MPIPTFLVEMMVGIIVCILLAGLRPSSCILNQAPGDGDPLCTEETIDGALNPFFANRPLYSANKQPLMDSRDYVRPLAGSGEAYLPWQSVDRDNNNSAQIISWWEQLGTAICAGTVTVCGFSEGPQENWLITQHINTVLPGGGGERLRKVTVQFEGTLNGCDVSGHCRQSFEVYKWETSTINRTAAANTDSYVRVGRISPAFTDGSTSFVELQDIELGGHEDGFYLAVVDFGTCVTLSRILVLYHVCPREISELISRPAAVAPESLGGSPSVAGECVENSSTESGTDPLLVCGARGQWHTIVPCLCNPGYELDTTQDQCIECSEGTFSADVSNGPCETCPANSEGTRSALSLCPCLQDYYRAPYEEPSDPCTRSPGPPSSLSVSNVTSTSVDLSWSPPVNNGGRPLSEIFYTITAHKEGVAVAVREVNGNETRVTGLTPGLLYTFSVTAENDVSSQDNTANARTLSITASTTEEEATNSPSSAASQTSSLIMTYSPSTESSPTSSVTYSTSSPTSSVTYSTSSTSSVTYLTPSPTSSVTSPTSNSATSQAPSKGPMPSNFPTSSITYSASSTPSPPPTAPVAPVTSSTIGPIPSNTQTSSSATGSSHKRTIMGLCVGLLLLLLLF